MFGLPCGDEWLSPAMTGMGSRSVRGAYTGAAGTSELRITSKPVAGFIAFSSSLSIPIANRIDPNPVYKTTKNCHVLHKGCCIETIAHIKILGNETSLQNKLCFAILLFLAQ